MDGNGDANNSTLSSGVVSTQQEAGTSFSAFLKFVAEVSTACAFLGFLLSILLHSLVFSRWKIDFVQIASPSDVLMSGMGFFVDLGLPLIGALFIGFIVSALVSAVDFDKLPPFFKKLGNILSYKLIRYPYIVLCLLIIAATILQFSRDTLPYFWMSMEDEPDREFINWLAVIGGLLIALGGYFAVKNEREGKLGGIPLLTASLGICFLLLFGFAFINYQAAQGFQQSRTIISLATDCGGVGRVLWLGSQSTVVRCEASSDPPKIIILRGSEATLQVAPRSGRGRR